MSKAKKKRFDKTKAILLSIIAALVVICVVLVVTRPDGKSTAKAGSAEPAVNVNLGAMQYSFAAGKATKRDDATVNSLKSFLQQTGEKDIKLGCQTTYYNVVRYTHDETQVLLNYGCAYPNAHMYALRSGTGWRLLSPTNQFDDLGIPKCDYGTKNNISREIAPVCVNGLDSGATNRLVYEAR